MSMDQRIKYFLAALTVIFAALALNLLRATWFAVCMASRFVLFFAGGMIFGMTLTHAVQHSHNHYDNGH